MFDDLTRLGASGISGSYEIEKSLRCNEADTAHLTRAFDEAGNRKTFTLSGWYKFTKPDSQHFIWMVGADGNNQFALIREGVTQLNFECMHSSSQVARFYTAARLRDPAAWVHLLLSIDTTQGTDTNRMKFYINGVQATLGGQGVSTQYPTQNLDFLWGENSVTHYMAKRSYAVNANDPSDYYMADSYYIDGLALDPDSFGETNTDTGQWIPKKYSGSYGNAGYFLDFSDNSGTTATTLGKDSSGNGNNWTPNNYSVSAGDGNDSRTDTPTNNKVTLNPIWHKSIATLTEGNLHMGGSAGFNEIATIGLPGTCSFYYEVVWSTTAGWNTAGIVEGLVSTGGDVSSFTHLLYDSKITAWHSTGASVQQGSYDASNGISWAANDVIGIKYVNGTLTIYKNGTAHGTTLSVSSNTSTIYPQIQGDGGSAAAYIRFSSSEWSQTPTGVDADWEVSINRYAEPTILKGTDHFNTVLYTGTGSSRTVPVGFAPNLTWIKKRNSSENHEIQDTVRGATKRLASNTTDTEATVAGSISAFTSDGFTVVDAGTTNENTHTYAAWNWKGGGSASSNGNGSITSSVNANASAGFSIVSYTGDDAASATVGHGLGVAPDVVIVKSRSDTTGWMTYHRSKGPGGYVVLNTNSSWIGGSGYDVPFANTNPTSSVFSVGDGGGNWGTNETGETYIAYCFSGIEGYSRFGSYKAAGGSGSTPNNNGVFIYTGFKPAFVLIKKASDAADWTLKDSVRSTYNSRLEMLFPNSSGAELNSEAIDFLSNGFKCRSASGYFDYPSGADYIYLAFAESPFKYSNAG